MKSREELNMMENCRIQILKLTLNETKKMSAEDYIDDGVVENLKKLMDIFGDLTIYSGYVVKHDIGEEQAL